VDVHGDVIKGSGDQKLTDLAQGVTWHIHEFKLSLLTMIRGCNFRTPLFPREPK
jgi:hypothetical protein